VFSWLVGVRVQASLLAAVSVKSVDTATGIADVMHTFSMHYISCKFYSITIDKL
jgi:hypothetical protein